MQFRGEQHWMMWAERLLRLKAVDWCPLLYHTTQLWTHGWVWPVSFSELWHVARDADLDRSEDFHAKIWSHNLNICLCLQRDFKQEVILKHFPRLTTHWALERSFSIEVGERMKYKEKEEVPTISVHNREFRVLSENKKIEVLNCIFRTTVSVM